MFFLPMVLFFCSFAVLAEHVQSEVAQIEQEKPQLTKENILQKTEVLRDPTQMSVNFRQALETYQPAANTTPGKTVVMPMIRLIAKVLAKPTKVAVRLENGETEYIEQNHSLVALEFNGNIVHLKEQDKTSVIKDNQLFTLVVDEITASYVQVRLLPVNETLLLH